MRLAYRLTSCLLAFGAFAAPASGQEGPCGNPMVNGTGPWDYRKAPPKYLRMVERRHYTPEVRALRRGTSTSDLGADVAYTLRVFPNHHRALLTMADWSLKSRANPPKGVQYPVECWFERGMRFRPDDGMVKAVYGIYLLRVSKADEAVKQLETAVAQGASDGNVHYNLGLAYLEAKQFDKALASAHRARAGGFMLPGLRDRLMRAGKWREAESAAPGPGGEPPPAAPERADPASDPAAPSDGKLRGAEGEGAV